jgi:hypothetical protein
MKKKKANYLYWLIKYLQALFFPHFGLPKGKRRDWITWKHYKNCVDAENEIETYEYSIKQWIYGTKRYRK